MPRDHAINDKLEISLPAIKLPAERKVMRILYDPILENESNREAEHDSQLEDTPPSVTTFRPSTSPAILLNLKKPTPSTESSIIDDDHLLVSSSSVLQTLPKLQTVVPYDLWPYSESAKPVQVDPIRFSSYSSGEDLNNEKDSSKDSSTVDSDSDSSAVNLKYYNLDPVQPSSYTRSTYELADHFTEPPRSHPTSAEYSSSPAGLSYSYFVFGSSSKPEDEESSRHKSTNGILTTQTSSSFLPDTDFDYEGITFPAGKENFEKTSKSRQKNEFFQTSLSKDRKKNRKPSKDEKENNSEELGTPLENFPPKDSFFNFDSTNENAARANGGHADDTIGTGIKSSSFYLSSPGPPYRDETSQLPAFQQEIINPTNNGGFIPPPPASSSFSNFKEISAYPPSRSIYDEIQKSTSLAKTKSNGKAKQTNDQKDLGYPKPSTLGDFGSSFQGLVIESPPKLKEEVLSFIKNYSENPFDLSLAGIVDSNFEPVNQYGSKAPHAAGNKNGSKNNETAYYQKRPQVNTTPSPSKDTTKFPPNSYTTHGNLLSSYPNPYRNASSVSSKPTIVKNSVNPPQANHLPSAAPKPSRKPDVPVLAPPQTTKKPVISHTTTTQTLSLAKFVPIPAATSRPQNAPSTTIKYEAAVVTPKPFQATVAPTIPTKSSAAPYPFVNLSKTQQLTINKSIQPASKSIQNNSPYPVNTAAYQPAFKPLTQIVPVPPQTLRSNNLSGPSRPIHQTAHVTSHLEHRPRPAPVPVAAPIPVYVSNGPKPKVYSPLSLSLARPISVIFAYGQ